MSKNIAVIGTGYVGLVSSVGLSDFGNTVIGVDLNEKIVEKLNRGEPTIYEHGLREYLERNLEAGRLSFTTKAAEAITLSEIIFLAVGTPPLPDGGADLSQIEAAAKTIGENTDGYKVVVTKSTVPVGTNRRIKEIIREAAAKTTGGPSKSGGDKGAADLSEEQSFDVVSNPEFLREGRAVQDFFHPDRVVIGYESDKAREYMEDVYRSLYLIQTPFVWCEVETAELIKYASNAFLATKITFINQMANLAEAVGADIHAVAKSMGMDGRISSKFLHPGPGYGGSCFPKDTKAVAATGEACGVDMSLIKEVVRANEVQKELAFEKLKRFAGGDLKGKTITVLGLAFKAETDDVRDSPAITLVRECVKAGAAVRLHDPEAMDNFAEEMEREEMPVEEKNRLFFANDSFEAVDASDALIILTEWNEYRNLDLSKAKSMMRGDVLYDARNVLDPGDAQNAGFRYIGTGRLVKD